MPFNLFSYVVVDQYIISVCLIQTHIHTIHTQKHTHTFIQNVFFSLFTSIYLLFYLLEMISPIHSCASY
uniref:Macaca fascicularis brain cDNA, clone: QflA-23478 n=1 Tax=Macaca fascicularis TaxID=9541 RepID=I7G7R5_MACFA|nr:unnamed protein product [Macaca fascicularis]